MSIVFDSNEDKTKLFDNCCLTVAQINDYINYLNNEEKKLESSFTTKHPSNCKLKEEEIDYARSLKRNISFFDDVKRCIESLLKDSLNLGLDNMGELKKTDLEKGLNVLEVQEKERKRIAMDLHDSTIQNLASLVHKTELSVKLLDSDVIRARLELLTMSNTIKTIIEDMRTIVHDLRPMSLEDLGLVITVERYIYKLMSLHDIQIILKSNPEIENVLSIINVTLFRIIQESCNNVIKHANATKITIDINNMEDEIYVTVEDNGKGIDKSILNDKNSVKYTGMGMSIMKERVDLLSGCFEIQTEINIGTKIMVKVPVVTKERKKGQ